MEIKHFQQCIDPPRRSSPLFLAILASAIAVLAVGSACANPALLGFLRNVASGGLSLQAARLSAPTTFRRVVTAVVALPTYPAQRPLFHKAKGRKLVFRSSSELLKKKTVSKIIDDPIFRQPNGYFFEIKGDILLTLCDQASGCSLNLLLVNSSDQIETVCHLQKTESWICGRVAHPDQEFNKIPLQLVVFGDTSIDESEIRQKLANAKAIVSASGWFAFAGSASEALAIWIEPSIRTQIPSTTRQKVEEMAVLLSLEQSDNPSGEVARHGQILLAMSLRSY